MSHARAALECWALSKHSLSVTTAPWVKAIRDGPFRVVNFASHFICVQIFQMEISACPSFYPRPNIPDAISGDKMYSSTSQLNHERSRVEIFYEFQIFDTGIIAQIFERFSKILAIFVFVFLGHSRTNCAVFLVLGVEMSKKWTSTLALFLCS